MDLGATLCTRGRPRCAECPIAADCRARAQGNVAAYPGRKPRGNRPLRATTMLLAVAGKRVYLERRPPAGIWGGLWSLPEIEGPLADTWVSEHLGTAVRAAQNWPVLRHGFTHFDLDISPLVLCLDEVPREIAEAGQTVWYGLDDEPPGGISAPVRKLLDTLRDMTDGANG